MNISAKKILLFDGLGALITFIMLWQVLARFEELFGMPKTAIPNVGWIAKFLDTEGNLICAMQYDDSAE
ncbi:VOC family protein [Cyclobacterium plantarum]|uniref:Uncharacterized protein n=1 Tax=Cyclobacterium plantarum TaxID=2716263 RepID=A0ABX0H2F1_9BACT|nr:hypothetical protein [Cyclobacterium plantarum]NHE55963.1 hypothetical protein [Cyclobacterium plantarum]